MATRATQPVQHPARTGAGLVIVVGVATAFLFLVAVLSAVQSGALFTESNLLFAALILYAASAVLYIGFGVSGIDRYVSAGSALMIGGWLCNTIAAGYRWYVAGHPPFASVYEMLLSFVCTLALLTLYAERREGVKLIGSVTMPIAVTSVVLMQLLPNDVHPLVPALQSTWLHVHVSLAMLAYAACALSFALAIMFLIKDQVRTQTFLLASSAFVAAMYAACLLTRFTGWGGFAAAAWDSGRKTEIVIENGRRLFAVIPGLGWMFLLAFAVVASPLLLFAVTRAANRTQRLAACTRAVFVGIFAQSVTLLMFVMRANGGIYAPRGAGAALTTSLAASPFILAGILSGIFASLLYLMLYWRRADLERLLPGTEALDRITYRTITVAFPLLTLMIAAGAYWANRTWGSYWSWDPKETWAAITWLVYAAYLHTRITRGWHGRRAAYFAIIGFAVVMFTFFGVTYLLPGLHAYA